MIRDPVGQLIVVGGPMFNMCAELRITESIVQYGGAIGSFVVIVGVLVLVNTY